MSEPLKYFKESQYYEVTGACIAIKSRSNESDEGGGFKKGDTVKLALYPSSIGVLPLRGTVDAVIDGGAFLRVDGRVYSSRLWRRA